MFRLYELRTTDPEAASAFYADVIGWQPGLATRIVTLPERAAARGAPPHWLGHLAAGDVEGALARFVARGAEPLGPRQTGDDGVAYVVARDPLGAVVALSTATEAREPSPVAWHQLHTTDRERAWAAYAEAFGWARRETWQAGGDVGENVTFAWDATGPAVGSMADTARNPGTHTHWLFFFEVPDVDAAVARVGTHGGETMIARQLPNGARVAVCHDPQRAEFGLYAR